MTELYTQKQNVTARRVFYIPGFDPIPPRRYRELYRRESKKQAEISDYEIGIKALSRENGKFRWEVDSTISGHKTHAEIIFLEWGDLVVKSMALNIFQTYILLLKTFWLYLRSGALRQLIRLRPQPMIAALFPVVMFSAYFFGGLLLGWILVWLARYAIPIPTLLGWVIAILVMCALQIYFKRKDNKIMAYYLMYDYGFSAKDGGRMPDILSERVDDFVDEISLALASGVDEVLLVGHSSGAHIGMHVCARLLREGIITKPEQLSLLTLGQVIPMVSFLPTAGDLRGDLNLVSKSDEVYWVDITAPSDGGCFALCDPVAVTGVAPTDGSQIGPLIVSAAFNLTLTKERAEAIRWKFFKAHFQYLCAFDFPRDYEYFAITAGPWSLKERFKRRSSTKATNREVLSPFKDMS